MKQRDGETEKKKRSSSRRSRSNRRRFRLTRRRYRSTVVASDWAAISPDRIVLSLAHWPSPSLSKPQLGTKTTATPSCKPSGVVAWREAVVIVVGGFWVGGFWPLGSGLRVGSGLGMGFGLGVGSGFSFLKSSSMNPFQIKQGVHNLKFIWLGCKIYYNFSISLVWLEGMMKREILVFGYKLLLEALNQSPYSYTDEGIHFCAVLPRRWSCGILYRGSREGLQLMVDLRYEVDVWGWVDDFFSLLLGFFSMLYPPLFSTSTLEE